ncbi:MAG TPA: hypothetical protein VKU60_15520 [Chloroflexota bacterium]|nr:hypothetical protein [Chloroflexota bacterium]
MIPDLIDEATLSTVIPQILGLSEADLQQPEVMNQVAELELKVDEARLTGRLMRYARQGAQTGAIRGHVYKKADLIRFVRAHATAAQEASAGAA